MFVTLPSAASFPAPDRLQGRILAQRTEMKTYNWASPKKLKYGEPRLGDSTLTKLVLDAPNLA